MLFASSDYSQSKYQQNYGLLESEKALESISFKIPVGKEIPCSNENGI
jgi:hypothetical protein